MNWVHLKPDLESDPIQVPLQVSEPGPGLEEPEDLSYAKTTAEETSLWTSNFLLHFFSLVIAFSVE